MSKRFTKGISIIIPFLHMRKVRHGWMWLAEGHPGDWWQSRQLNPGFLSPNPVPYLLGCASFQLNLFVMYLNASSSRQKCQNMVCVSLYVINSMAINGGVTSCNPHLSFHFLEYGLYGIWFIVRVPSALQVNGCKTVSILTSILDEPILEHVFKCCYFLLRLSGDAKGVKCPSSIESQVDLNT